MVFFLSSEQCCIHLLSSFSLSKRCTFFSKLFEAVKCSIWCMIKMIKCSIWCTIKIQFSLGLGFCVDHFRPFLCDSWLWRALSQWIVSIIFVSVTGLYSYPGLFRPRFCINENDNYSHNNNVYSHPGQFGPRDNSDHRPRCILSRAVVRITSSK